ncbi:OmpA family protein [Sulfurimonas sp. HSL3-7]|uniref:OmpA family protein n=1 Tax=Sulfonitrofixus jiaomeiensis TaxID=3131938 RepID=UPI0031F76E8B
MNGLLMKLLLLPLLFSVFGYAGTYDYSYSPLSSAQESGSTMKDPFLYGDFEKIIRFTALQFDGEALTADSQKSLDTIVKTIESYQEDGKKMGITIIAHTAATTDDQNENTIESDTYAGKIIRWFSKDLDRNASVRISEGFAEEVQKLLADRGVDKNMTTLENRNGRDQAFSDATSEGRNLSNRVMVTLYLFTQEEVDSDGDGVFDSQDVCPKTPQGVTVNSKGCPLDSDGDGVYDYKDQCPGTPTGVEVNSGGCPFDSDTDGVSDYADQCPDTPPSFKVDPHGCPLSKKLMLTFTLRSSDIRDESYPEVKAFAEFLKENTQYKAEIVGHTDSTGKKAYNMALSQARANAVKEALIKEGVAASRLKSRGRGEFDPIADNRTQEGRQANRRIEVKLYY